MSVNWTVVGGLEIPSPIRVTSDTGDAVNSYVRGSTDGGSDWRPLYVDSNGKLVVTFDVAPTFNVVSGAWETEAGGVADLHSLFTITGTLSTSGATTVATIAVLETQRVIFRRLVGSIGHTTTTASALQVLRDGTVYASLPVMTQGAPAVLAEPLAPLVVYGPAGGGNIVVQFTQATGATATFGLVVQAVLEDVT